MNKKNDRHSGILCAQYFLNHRLDPKEIAWQVKELAAAGYDGLYAHARPGLLTPYMSDAWWRCIDAIMEACRKHGLEFWIWDEDYYPSGLAGGRVVWSNPGLVCRTLDFSVKEAGGSGPFEIDFDAGMLIKAFALKREPSGIFSSLTDVTGFCGTRRQKWHLRALRHGCYSPMISAIGHPHWRAAIEDNRFALVWRPPRRGNYTFVAVLEKTASSRHPDLLKPDGIRKFIELSYEPYFKRYGKEFGKLIRGAFTDEPSPGGGAFPWNAAFPGKFRNDHGYDLIPHLAHLAVEIDQRTPVIRHHYRLTQHRLQEENYAGQISRWCRKHGISFTGHLTRTEWLSLVAAWWPNEIRMYRRIAIPTCDPLGASEGWKAAASYHTAVKVVSSAAHLFNKKQAGSDALAVVGDEVSLRDLKYLCDHQIALGINFFAIHGLSCSLDGPRKDEVPPSLFYQHSEWKYMRVLADYLKNTCMELTGGKHLCRIAILYPSTSLACQVNAEPEKSRNLRDEDKIHRLIDELLSHQCDFDFIDEVTLQKSVGRNGKLAGPERYRTIILPYLRFIDWRTAQALNRYAAAGNRALAIGAMPSALPSGLKRSIRGWHHAAIEQHKQLTADIIRSLHGVPVKGKGADDVFVLRRKKNAANITFAFNRREKDFEGTVAGCAVTIPGRGSVLIRDGKVPPEPALETAADISANWRISFPHNHLPLSFWHSAAKPFANVRNIVNEPGYDLMQRARDPVGEGAETATYYCRFMLTGSVPDARLVMDESGVMGKWKAFVNGREVKRWRKAVVYDCRNIQADIGHLLAGDSTPTLNIIAIETSGPGRGLKEIPYLYGSFTCSYRYGHLSFPFVNGPAGAVDSASLQPWNLLGYPTFSGSAVYTKTLAIREKGPYLLELGRVEDVAEVFLDGKRITTLAWPPYRCQLGCLDAGNHSLKVEVANPPANRNRAANLPAGLLGPVRLCHSAPTTES